MLFPVRPHVDVATTRAALGAGRLAGKRRGLGTGRVAGGSARRVENKRVDEFENMSDEELRQYVYRNMKLDS